MRKNCGVNKTSAPPTFALRASVDKSGALVPALSAALVSAASANFEDELSYVTAAFLHSVRIGGAIERERLMHDRLDRALLQQRPHVFEEIARDHALLRRRAGTQRRSGDPGALPHHHREIELRLRAFQERDLHQP